MSSTSKNTSRSTKKNFGRRKVNMEKIENEANLQVTFSKRRSGLFKKASELCTLSGSEAGLVVFSPSNKAHAFGHPDINAIANRFLLSVNVQQSSIPVRTQEDEYLAMLEKQIEVEKARREELKKQAPPFDLDKLSYQQLVAFRGSIVEFAKGFEARAKEAKGKKPMVPSDDDDVIPYDGGATSCGGGDHA